VIGKKFSLPEFGYEVELGKYATQADGAAWFKHGGTVVLATACSSPSKEFPGFLPLTVDYREQFSAAGKIPGGYFKREGKFTDREVLTSRLIDRAIRPLFPANYFNQVQVLITVYSVDKEHTPQTIALIAASLALSVSKIPLIESVGAAEIGRVDGKWVVNPSYSDGLKSDVRIVVAGTADGICMVEGSTNEISEKEMIDAFFMAHDAIKKQVAWQGEIQKQVGTAKEEIADEYGWKTWESRVDAYLTEDLIKKLYIADKVERNKNRDEITDAFLEQHKEELTTKEIPEKVIAYIFDQLMKPKITDFIIKLGKRIDGRSFDQVRAIATEVGILPFAHGSALFQRGRTQALVSSTLGSGQDEQRFDELMGESTEGRFMLHYNFPPFSVGEVRPQRGPGRREVGHGYLALSSFKYVMPSKEEFPYTIRVVADMLESDGSTSMATTCGTTMALMNTGVPIKKMISGIAMGLLGNAKGEFRVLSDISGFEDEFGLMDFKVTGTDDGIAAIQMDIKHKGGLTRQIFEQALEQAKKSRAHIMGEMRKVMTKPNPTLSDLVPKIVSFKVDPSKVGAIIGTGGKTIREIIEKTGTTIDIDNGMVNIFGVPGANIEMAVNWVKTLGGQIEKGATYVGKIRRFADFGIFVELVPGVDGLVHVSNVPREKQKTFGRDYQMDQAVTVEVLDYDKETDRIRLRIVE
jgi:polyribonucleotide nucleotidyltransferase